MRSASILFAIAVAACATGHNLTQRCTNTHHGFAISYPAGWYTNSGDVIPTCSAFDAKPVEIPPESEIPFDIPIVAGVERIPIAQKITSSQWERVLTAERMTIGGRDAYRIEAEATGEGLADRGMRTLRYAIDLGNGLVLIAETHDTGESHERNRQVLEQMIQTVTWEPRR